MTDTGYAYVGTCPKCNSMCCAAVDEPNHAADVAEYVSAWIKEGLVVSRVTNDEVRAKFAFCTCDRVKEESATPTNQARLF